MVKTRLGEYDASGRRRPVPTDEIQRFDCDTVILAVGETVDLDFARASGLRIKESGTIEVDRYTLETSRAQVLRRRRPDHRRVQRLQRHGLRQEGGAQHRPAADGREALGRSSVPEFEYEQTPPDEPSRSRAAHRPASCRRASACASFDEVVVGLVPEEALEEACRCLRCDIRERAALREGATDLPRRRYRSESTAST